MAVNAAQIAYRDEFVASFERRTSLLTETTTTEAVIKGNVATFLVAGSGGRTAVTRGTNGLIPTGSTSQTQPTCTLNEWHDKESITDYNVFSSQGNQREIAMMNTAGVINRKRDELIITELATGTLDAGAVAKTADMGFVMHALTILMNNDVQLDGNVFAAITPAFYANLMQVKEFASADYVSDQKFVRGGMRMIEWANVKWVVHTGLPGLATAVEKCFMYHKSAIGSAIDKRGMQITGGENEEHDYYWHRAKFYGGAKLLQNTGVVVWTHDGSGYAST